MNCGAGGGGGGGGAGGGGDVIREKGTSGDHRVDGDMQLSPHKDEIENNVLM